MQTLTSNDKAHVPNWSHLIPDNEWALYRKVLDGMLDQKIPFALGGGFAFSFHALRWRDTKDIDLYVLPRDRERTIEIVESAGFRDLHGEKPYDRAWIYRGTRERVIADIIWAMANQRAQVDDDWLQRGPEVELRGLRLKMLPAEELIWAKLYIIQRERCDWPDLLNILYVRGATLDWQHLLGRVDGEARVLGGLLNVFSWMCPGKAAELPSWIWEPMSLRPPAPLPDVPVDSRRVALLDGRDWFGPEEGSMTNVETRMAKE